MITMTDPHSGVRERIVQAAARLLTEGGREAVSTRAVSAAAGVQAPTIYRQFEDMQALLLAAARAVLSVYVRDKARAARPADPVKALREGWDLHVAFGLANPAAYALLNAEPAASEGAEAEEGRAHLTLLVTRVAEAGRLRVSVPLAVTMIHAAGCGVTLTLIATAPEARDPRLSRATRDAVLSAILIERQARTTDSGGRLAARAVGMRALLGDAKDVLSSAETQLMGEWLDRIAAGPSDSVRKPAVKRRRKR